MQHPASRQLAQLHHAVNSRDMSALMQCYCQDARLIEKPVLSIGAQLDDALSSFRRRYMPEHQVVAGDEVVVEQGDIALVMCKLYLQQGTATSEAEKAVYVFRREADGQWRCAIDNFFGVKLLDYV